MQFDHYTVRLLHSSDIDRYYQMVDSNRPCLEDYFAGTVSKTKTYGDTKIFLEDVMARIANKVYIPFVVIDETNGKFVGYVDVKNIDWNLPKAELGCYFDSNYVGKGLSKKALSLVIAHLFSEHGFNKLFLRTHESNTAARALAESCGFEKEGLLRKDYKNTRGEIIDLLYYGLVRG